MNISYPIEDNQAIVLTRQEIVLTRTVIVGTDLL